MLMSILPALAVFGALFAITIIGLVLSNRAAARNNATTPQPANAQGARDTASRPADWR